MRRARTQDWTMARLLASKAVAEESGILTADRGKLKRLFCLQKGWLVFVASNIIEEQLDEYLVRNGVLAPSDRVAAATEASKRKKKVASVLLERGVIPEESLRKSLEELIRTQLSSCLEWPDGKYAFTPGQPSLDGGVTVRLSPIHQLLCHARNHPASLKDVRARIGPPDFRPQRTAESEQMLSSLPSRGAVMDFLLERCDGNLSVRKILEQTPGGDEETLRALFGLLLLGIVDKPSRARETAAQAQDGQLTEEECLALLRRAEGADHYSLFDLGRRAPRSKIRSAYYSLARRYHPDRFRSGDLQELAGRIETYFSRVTEAYNTLYNPELRAEYDRQLQEQKAGKEAESDLGTAQLARQNYLKARELIRRRRYTEAARFLENAIQLEGRAEYHLELGQLLSGNPRRRADAEEHLLRAAKLNPSCAGAYLALGRLYRKAGRNADAARMFRETLRWDPGDAEASSQLSELGDTGEPSEGRPLQNLLRG